MDVGLKHRDVHIFTQLYANITILLFPVLHTRYILGVAAPDSATETDVACGLANFHSRSMQSCFVEALRERDDGSTVYVLLLKRIPPVDDKFNA